MCVQILLRYIYDFFVISNVFQLKENGDMDKYDYTEDRKQHFLVI